MWKDRIYGLMGGGDYRQGGVDDFDMWVALEVQPKEDIASDYYLMTVNIDVQLVFGVELRDDIPQFPWILK